MTASKFSMFKATVWYAVSNILVKGVAFFVLPIFTDLMTTEEYGIYSVYTSFLAIAEVIVLFGLSSTVRIAMYDKEVNFERYVATIIFIPPLLGLAFAVPLNIYLLFENSFLSMSAELWNFLLLTVSFSSIANIICAKLVIEGRYKLYSLYSVLFTFLNVGLSLALCFTIFRNDHIYMARIIGVFVSQTAAAVLLAALSKSFHKIDIKYVKRSLIWGFPLLLHTLATVVLTQSDKLVIRYVDSYSSAGIYAIAAIFVTIPLVLYTSFENAWAPWFYRNLSDKNYSKIQKFNNVYILGVFLLICLFMLVSPTLVRLFTNEAYWDSAYCLIPLTGSVFFELLYGISVSVEYFNKKTWFITFGTVLTMIINIGLDVVFVSLWGYVAAAYATTLSKAL